MDPVIRTERLTKVYKGGVVALDRLDLAVDRGEAFGFIGPNGAGKTTLIRLLLDLLRPTAGRAEVLGRDARAGGVALRRHVGYLPGELRLDERLTARDTLTFLGRLQGMRDFAPAWALAERFDLPLDRPARDLSKGNKQKIGIVQAFQHRPDLVVLDEPTSGLDPILQQTFHELVREARQDGLTAFVSSHILSELEHVADRVAMVHKGRLLAVQRIGELKRDAPHRVAIRFAAPVPEDLFAGVPGIAESEVTGSLARLVVRGSMDAAIKRAAEHEVIDLDSVEPDLEEIFLAYYGAAEEGESSASAPSRLGRRWGPTRTGAEEEPRA